MDEYKAALEVFRRESAAWREVQDNYRARKIGDDEFIAGMRKFRKANAEMDAVEAKHYPYIKAS